MQAPQMVKNSKFAHTCVRKLEKKSGGQEYKGESVGMPPHTCVSTLLGQWGGLKRWLGWLSGIREEVGLRGWQW